MSGTGDGNVRVWKDFTLKGKQKVVTAFSALHGSRPGVRISNAVVDWQQQSGYLVELLICLIIPYYIFHIPPVILDEVLTTFSPLSTIYYW